MHSISSRYQVGFLLLLFWHAIVIRNPDVAFYDNLPLLNAWVGVPIVAVTQVNKHSEPFNSK